MQGTLPNKADDFGFVSNGFQCHIGVWADIEYAALVCVKEKVKGGGLYAAGNNATWERVHAIDDVAFELSSKFAGDFDAMMAKFLSDCNAKLPSGNTQPIPPMPTELVAKLKWYCLYRISYNPQSNTLALTK